MYVPPRFAMSDPQELLAFARTFNFATLITCDTAGRPVASHVPVLVDATSGGQWLVRGHLARANDQPLEGDALVIFSGPHAYVSPTWYAEPNTVPTWNYVTVHVTGCCKRVDDAALLGTSVRDLTAVEEAQLPTPWEAQSLDAPVLEKLLTGIVGFEVRSSAVQGNWKLSQHHPEGRRRRTIDALRARGSEDQRAIAALMEKSLPPG